VKERPLYQLVTDKFLILRNFSYVDVESYLLIFLSPLGQTEASATGNHCTRETEEASRNATEVDAQRRIRFL